MEYYYTYKYFFYQEFLFKIKKNKPKIVFEKKRNNIQNKRKMNNEILFDNE